MTDNFQPYQLPPRPKPHREEQKLIQIKEDSPSMPSSIGTDNFHATIFGAPALQPSKSEDGQKGLSCGAVVILALLFGPLVIFLISELKGLFY